MTDQTPRTEAGRRLLEYGDLSRPTIPATMILAIEDEAAAQARTEALDVEVLARALANDSGFPKVQPYHEKKAANVAREYRAILAGETE